ncbi:MAG: nuclear transport factor 2 family protein [Flavitalea sp.]
MPAINEVVMQFNELIHQQKFLEAIDQFYHPDVISGDNSNPPIIGTEKLKASVQHFIENATIHKIEIVSLLIEKDLSVTNWFYAFDHKDLGSAEHHQFSMQRWKDNKIVQEQHFYAE